MHAVGADDNIIRILERSGHVTFEIQDLILSPRVLDKSGSGTFHK